MINAVIMAGGSGTRFWPQSRQTRPKQLLRLAGERSLIQSTFDRSIPLVSPENVWVVTNAAQAAQTRRHLPDVPAGQVLIEPCGRNTAPCIGLAAIHLLARDRDAVMAVMPADHVISPPAAFQDALRQAAALIEDDPQRLVLFGVKPTYPATGFGYIERGESLVADPPSVASDTGPPHTHTPAWHVASFREKPDQNTAAVYVEAGTFYWNCGIFVWKARTILEQIERFEPEIHERLMRLAGHLESDTWEAAVQSEFPQMKSISIDYGVLERAENICVLEASFEWDDVGSWEALERLIGADEARNTVRGLHCGIDTSGCIIRSEEDHLVATYGLEDLIVVHTPDATLVAPRNDESAVRKLVEHIRRSGYERFL